MLVAMRTFRSLQHAISNCLGPEWSIFHTPAEVADAYRYFVLNYNIKIRSDIIYDEVRLYQPDYDLWFRLKYTITRTNIARSARITTIEG